MSTMKAISAMLLLPLIACTRTQGASKEPPAEEPVRDAALADPPARDAGSASLFSLTYQGEEVKLHRVTNGPVLGVVGPNGHVLYALTSAGELEPVDPVVALFADTYSDYWRVGSIAGEWPRSIFLETGVPGARVEALVKNHVFDAESGKIETREWPGTGHVGSSSPWSEGRTLGFIAKDSTFDFESGRGGGGEFTVLIGGKPATSAMPRVPKQAITSGQFVAYPSGRIFLVGTLKTKDKEPVSGIAMTHIWDFVDGMHATAVEMPDAVVQLERGRTETEAFARGDSFLVRFDGKSWSNVPLPDKDLRPRDISIGEDGSAWLIASPKRAKERGAVYRAALPDLRWEHVPLQPDLDPESLVARNANDVWLTATRPKSTPNEPDPNEHFLLHTHSPSRSPVVLPDKETLERAALAKKVPRKFSPSCPLPFLSLGTESQVKEEEAVALEAKLPDWPYGNPTLGRIHAGKVYGFELPRESGDKKIPPQYRTPSGVLKTVSAIVPTASLICTKPIVERKL